MRIKEEEKIEQEFFFEIYHKKSLLQKLFNSDFYETDISEYTEKFRSCILEHLWNHNSFFKSNNLENLQNFYDSEKCEYGDFMMNSIQRSLYDLNKQISPIYFGFISNYLKNIFPFDFYFQREITFRVHIPQKNGDISLSNPYPNFHTDACFGHPPNEINIWIPLTKPFPKEFHFFNISSVENSKNALAQLNYLPRSFDKFLKNGGKIDQEKLKHNKVTTDYGKTLIFDSRCMHSAMPIKYQTRVSIDIRIIPINEFLNLPYEFKGTGKMQTLWAPGFGYDKLKSSEL